MIYYQFYQYNFKVICGKKTGKIYLIRLIDLTISSLTH